MTKKAYSYIRFSSAEQSKGDSERRQRAGAEAYCKANGLVLATDAEYTFTDRGLSAYSGQHLGDKGQLKRFLALIEDGTIDQGSTLIVESLDRLSRQEVGEAFGVLQGITNAGVRVVTLTDRRVYEKGADIVSLMVSIIEMSRAHSESLHKSQRVSQAFKRKQELARTEGKPMGKAHPLWLALKADGSGYEEVKERADVVRRVFQMALDGYGKAVIARELNAAGVPSFKGKTWGTSSVDKVLKNRAVIGEYQPHSGSGSNGGKQRQPTGEPIVDYYPAVVDVNTFYAAQAAIEGRRTAGATKQSVRFNVWQGVCKCIHCGSAMHVIRKGGPPKGADYIECAKGRKGLCEPHKLIRLDQSEQVFRLILGRLDSMALVKDSGAKLARELKAVEGRLLEQRGKLSNYAESFRVSGSVTVAQIISSTEAEIEHLEKKREALRGELAAEDAIGFDTFMERLDLESYEGRNRANALLKRLDVLVFAGREGFVVSDRGAMRFAARYQDGKAGYLERSHWRQHRPALGEPLHEAASKVLKHALPIHFVWPSKAGQWAYQDEEDAYERWADAQEGDGLHEGY